MSHDQLTPRLCWVLMYQLRVGKRPLILQNLTDGDHKIRFELGKDLFTGFAYELKKK